MTAEVIRPLRFRKVWRGDRNNRHFVAHPQISKREHKKCGKCGRKVRRSWRTGILHSNCFTCRYLVMIYGPSIEVRWTGEDE